MPRGLCGFLVILGWRFHCHGQDGTLEFLEESFLELLDTHKLDILQSEGRVDTLNTFMDLLDLFDLLLKQQTGLAQFEASAWAC